MAILSILAQLLPIIVLIVKHMLDNDAAKKQKALDEDAKIDAAHSFDDFVRIDDELHNK